MCKNLEFWMPYRNSGSPAGAFIFRNKWNLKIQRNGSAAKNGSNMKSSKIYPDGTMVDIY